MNANHDLQHGDGPLVRGVALKPSEFSLGSAKAGVLVLRVACDEDLTDVAVRWMPPMPPATQGRMCFSMDRPNARALILLLTPLSFRLTNHGRVRHEFWRCALGLKWTV